MYLYTALHVVSDLFYRQDFIKFNISNNGLNRQIHIKTHQQLYYNVASNISTVNKKCKRMGLFLAIFNFIVIFETFAYLVIVSFSLIQNVYLSAGVAARSAEHE